MIQPYKECYQYYTSFCTFINGIHNWSANTEKTNVVVGEHVRIMTATTYMQKLMRKPFISQTEMQYFMCYRPNRSIYCICVWRRIKYTKYSFSDFFYPRYLFLPQTNEPKIEYNMMLHLSYEHFVSRSRYSPQRTPHGSILS